MEETVEGEGESYDIRQHIMDYMEGFKEVLGHMKNCREEMIADKEAKLKIKRDQKRTEKLFKTKLDGLNKKPEFKSTIASQYWINRDYFSKIAFLEHGPMMEPQEKEALLAPDRVYDRKNKWIPTDDVITKQRHLYFDDSLPPPPIKSLTKKTKKV